MLWCDPPANIKRLALSHQKTSWNCASGPWIRPHLAQITAYYFVRCHTYDKCRWQIAFIYHHICFVLLAEDVDRNSLTLPERYSSAVVLPSEDVDITSPMATQPPYDEPTADDSFLIFKVQCIYRYNRPLFRNPTREWPVSTSMVTRAFDPIPAGVLTLALCHASQCSTFSNRLTFVPSA